MTARARSIEALHSTPPAERALLRNRVLDFIGLRGADGATCDEVEQAMRLTHQTASARINELMNAGKIREGGRRKTRSGRSATVWVVPAAGQLVLFR
jgi:predicted transcriptional regulator